MNDYGWNLDFIAHYGVPHGKGPTGRGSGRYPWGSGNNQKNRVASSPEGLSSYMKKNFTYDDSIHNLKSSAQLLKDGSGNCHDQTNFELEQLRAMGKNPKAKFLIEVDDNGQGGMTHSFAYYKEGNKFKYFENAWGGHEGIKTFNSEKDIERYFQNSHSNGEFGNNNRFNNLYFGDFGGKPGDSLQQIVDKSLD